MPVIEEQTEGPLKIVYFQELPIIYFATPYSLPKLDMAAIPDFAFGAMENYGLVTYRETALLYDDRHSAAANKQRVATVVAHELAHQWFGNLVTMEWWTHLWLNEGFATGCFSSMESHPTEVEIGHAHEIKEIFDAVTYQKGASIIRMLQSYLGAECFQILGFLHKKICLLKCKDQLNKDLWAVREEESGEPVNMLINSWTMQKVYPLVSITMKDHKLELEQVHCCIPLAFELVLLFPLFACVRPSLHEHIYLTDSN
ncbi:hypothetical protein Sjap_011791 [Stephania japonica]|uniref:Peptidase M1 membrane alanine aminopeptidase domain-containing protein n=1 Tax=Stephania japonica TaxID=461633 RepID=A0AAP0P5V7_9MAGN